MSDQEFKKTMAALKTAERKHKASPKAALAFLVRAGIATKAGKLAKPYKQKSA